MKKKTPIVKHLFGVMLIIIGLFYLFAPESWIFLDLNLDHYRHIALGGLLLVVGSILLLNGKRLMSGVFIRGWRKNPNILIWIYLLTFAVLYSWFNSGFELFAGDVNNFKIILYRISASILSLMLVLGMVKADTVFGIKNSRY